MKLAPSARLSTALCLAAVISRPTSAQERTLHWRAVDVQARLDTAGRLHVRERQSIVFTGDWNGGERTFNVRLGQDFQFQRLLRVDSLSGAERPMREGDLSNVDDYQFKDSRTLRWRSRRPTDPPFANTEITYALEYSYVNILVPRGDAYVLDHDFAFSDRAGDIEAFTLDVAIDPVWSPPRYFRAHFGPMRLPPGEGFVVSVPLTYSGAGRPDGVEFGAEPPVRYALAAVLIGGVVLMLAAFMRREAALGRFAPATSARDIDQSWLEANVFHLLPEVVGAAWDDRTSAPEVAAVLARMVAEGKLSSEVKTSKVLFFQRDVLTLRLLVDRSTLRDYERDLVDALFDPGSMWTDTDQVRQRYKSTGFDPATVIRKSIERLAGSSGREPDAAPKPSRWPTLLLLGLSVALLIVGGAKRSGTDIVAAIVGVGVALGAYVVTVSQALPWRVRVQRLEPHALRFLVPLAALVGGFLVVLIDGPFRIGSVALASLTALCLAVANSVLNAAKSRQGARRIAQRRELAVARDYLRGQLRQPQPRLRDEWYPYLIAFGLGPHIDHWFRAFGGQGRTTSDDTFGSVSSRGSPSISSPSGPSWSGFGGGGGFGGSGSSGSWAAAVSSMAAGVSAPSSSSSSSSGGSSSGGSSGGGGGGGW